MSGKARRASLQRWTKGWRDFLWTENEVYAYVVKVDWVRGQYTVREQYWDDGLPDSGQLKTFPIPMRQIREHINSAAFPHQARCLWCDGETGEPLPPPHNSLKKLRRFGYDRA